MEDLSYQQLIIFNHTHTTHYTHTTHTLHTHYTHTTHIHYTHTTHTHYTHTTHTLHTHNDTAVVVLTIPGFSSPQFEHRTVLGYSFY